MRGGRLRAALLCFPLAGVLLGLSGCGHHAAAAAAPKTAPPVPVKVAPVVERSVPIYGNWIATLHGYVTAQIQPHVTGYLIRQDYREGAFVQKGQVLFEIDPRPFQAALDQAQAELAEAKAKLDDAVINVNRDIPEAKAHAIPQSQLDNDTQAKLAAKANVEAAKAAVETAQLNLGYTKVRSLVRGVAGITTVQAGNLVTPSTVLTTVSQVKPIKAYFPISGQEYLAIADRVNPGTVNLLATENPIPLQLTLSNGRVYPLHGRILFADRQIDSQTGTIEIVGSFPNPRGILRPGQTGRIRAVTEIEKNALLVPQRAVTQLQGGYEVAVVGAGNKVMIHNVQVGPQVGSLWVIASGLAPGDRVVAEGVDKVRDGAVVAPAAYVPPAADPANAGSASADPAGTDAP